MNVREIVYLDNSRLTSFLSQLTGGVAERATETQTDATNASTPNEISSFVHEAALERSGISQQFARVHEVRYFDHLLSQFLDAVDESVVRLNQPNLRLAAERAFRQGSIVGATGPLFLDDFAQIAQSLETSPKYFRLLELISKVSTTVSTASSGFSKDDRRRQRRGLSVAQNSLKGAQDLMVQVGAAIQAIYGDAVECGVALNDDSSCLVRVLLDRNCLRESTGTLVQRYGTKTAINFTVIGTITKLGWSEMPSFAKSDRGDEGTGEGQTMRSAIQTVQSAIDVLREQVMTVGDGDSISVAPLVVFRSLDIGSNSGSGLAERSPAS